MTPSPASTPVRGSSFNDTIPAATTRPSPRCSTGWPATTSSTAAAASTSASYNNICLSTAGVTVNMAAGTVIGDASIGTDTLRSIEQSRARNFADTYDAVGFGGTQHLNVGNNGTFNSFKGLGGNDHITGNGNTQIVYSNAAAAVTVNLPSDRHGTAAAIRRSGRTHSRRRQQHHRFVLRRHADRRRQQQHVHRRRRQRHHQRRRRAAISRSSPEPRPATRSPPNAGQVRFPASATAPTR